MMGTLHHCLRAGPHGWSSAAAEAEAEAEAEEQEQEQEQAVLVRISAACVRYAPPVASPFLSSPLLGLLSPETQVACDPLL